MTRVQSDCACLPLLGFALLPWVDNHDFAFPFLEPPQAWREILTRIRTEFPYFTRRNGADHFSVLTMDHGRCCSLTFLPPALYGEMFFLQSNGDKLVRSDDIGNYRNMQVCDSPRQGMVRMKDSRFLFFIFFNGYFSALVCT